MGNTFTAGLIWGAGFMTASLFILVISTKLFGVGLCG